MSDHSEDKKTSLSGQSMSYLDEQYTYFINRQYEKLDPSTIAYFEDMQGSGSPDQSHVDVIEAFRGGRKQLAERAPTEALSADIDEMIQDNLLGWFEHFGHYFADLGMNAYPRIHDCPVSSDGWSVMVPARLLTIVNRAGQRHTEVREDSPHYHYLESLKSLYQGPIGFEYRHNHNQDVHDWFRKNLTQAKALTPAEQLTIFKQLYSAQALELYLGRQHIGQKRFSLEGAESFIVALDALIASSSQAGVTDVVLGMAHRGRLNAMVNVLGLPCADIDSWFKGFRPSDESISGDVKYHLGYSCDRVYHDQRVHITLNFNPSHLESIVPVTMGVTRARQEYAQEQTRQQGFSSVLPVLVHGDASVVGQGVVTEALNMSYTDAYHVGGVVHLVINNQIGFTTTPEQGRSSYYCTDFFKTIGAPIIHVNGDDPEAVYRAALLAAAYRGHFHSDIVVDIISYRKHGHNEADDPVATSPLLYEKIAQLPSVVKCYETKLLAKSQDVSVLQGLRVEIDDALKNGHALVDVVHDARSSREVDWDKHDEYDWREMVDTTLTQSQFDRLATFLVTVPEGFSLQRQVAKLLDQRHAMFSGEVALNWGAAEAMAFASLLDRNVSIRLIGQDVCRGTFSHRHAVLYDQKTGQAFTPLTQVASQSSARMWIYNSTLSEYAAMGFEYGYSLNSPKNLVIWEAQFGDFVNGAQVIIDQYISSAWQKWGRMSGLVLLLPHGYEGQGPEHSSARVERFLQLCAQNNFQLCVPSTPGQYYHVLCRQMLRDYRSPLVLISPKSLLRHPAAVSEVSEMIDGAFQVVLDTTTTHSPRALKRVVLCSGKVYYDLMAEIEKQGLKSVAVCRLEQQYPFPRDDLSELMAKYKNVASITWCQEEPQNMGGWYVLKDRIIECLQPKQRLYYAGREKMASPAPGDFQQYQTQQHALVCQALGLAPNPFEGTP